MAYPIRRGYIYLVRDGVLRLPPEDAREVHSTRRPFLVLSGDTTNSDGAYLVAAGCPISKSTRFRTEFCVKVSAGEGNLPEKGWVRTHALQPVLKSDLQDCTGKALDDERIEQVVAQLERFLGVIPYNPLDIASV